MKHDKILQAARDRMDRAVTADEKNRKDGADDLEKLVGEQWPDKIRTEREAELKPCLVVNQLPQHVRQVTGDIRRMNPSINITAADDAADDKVAELIEGMVRQIEYASDGSSVYEQAAERAAASSIGWFRILNEWTDDDSFEQEIRLKGIRDSNSVYCDPEAELPTREDANYIFITRSMSKDDFEAEYPGKGLADFEGDGATDNLRHWRNEGDVVVAEYYWKEPETYVIGQLANGEIVKNPTAAHDVRRKRTVESHKVMWAKLSGEDVLEGPREVPSRYIPVISVTGEEWVVGDRVHRSSVIRYAKDPQQMLNYWVSANAEITALQPKAPFLLTVKQVAGLEEMWAEANARNRAFLLYNPDEKAPQPTRVAPPISSQGIHDQIMLAGEFIKSTTGIYDAGLGNAGNEKSGVAIRQRQMESDVSTSIYADNMAKAIAHAGRVIVDMIPRVYDTQRLVRVLSRDDQEKLVQINGQQLAANEYGQLVPIPVNDVRIGKYDVRVSVGPNYATRRQETQEGMLEFIRAFPAAGQLTADLVAKTMDWPDADQFAERLRKGLPPGLIGPDEMSDEERQEMQQAVQAQAMQAQMAQEAQMMEFRKAGAEATEAEADAQKAQVDVMDAQLELAAKNGQLQAVIQQEVARALMALMQQGQGPTY